MNFRRIEELPTDPQEIFQESSHEGDNESKGASGIYNHGPTAPKRKLEEEDSDNLTNLRKFRRIQLVNIPFPRPRVMHPRRDPDALHCTVEGCSAQFRGKYGRGNLARHSKVKHAFDVGIYHCKGGCDKIFFRGQYSLLQHYRRIHPNMATLPPIPRPRHDIPYPEPANSFS